MGASFSKVAWYSGNGKKVALSLKVSDSTNGAKSPVIRRREGLVAKHFGTQRGLVRLLLAYGQVAGHAAGIVAPDPQAVRRLVFVCHGNICRSAFAEAAACRAGLASCSFGLFADSGIGADPPVIAEAGHRGIDLAHHRAATSVDYEPRSGDLLLAMEVRQLHALAADARLAQLPRSLLGLWASPRRPHVHDPYFLGPTYLVKCLDIIEAAVAGLACDFPWARHT